VLESCGGDQARAIDMLLGMNDPSYVSGEPAAPSQTELDEELARRLAQEDQEEFHANVDMSVPYEARRQAAGNRGPQRRSTGAWADAPGQGQYGDGQYQQAGGRDTMTEMTEGFNRLAESGKKTFSSFVSKVKAKIQDFDQSRNTNAAGSSAQQQDGYGEGPVGGQRNRTQPSYYGPQGGYDVGPGPETHDARSQRQTSMSQPPTIPRPVPTDDDFELEYEDVSNPPIAIGSNRTAVSPAATSPISPAAVPERPSTETPRPPSTSSGTPPVIDRSKFGMLPKQSVSLLPATAPQTTRLRAQERVADDDEGGLDYVENPFDEEHR